MADTRLIIPIHRSKIVKILAGIVLVLIAFHGLVLYLIFVLKRDYALGFVPLTNHNGTSERGSRSEVFSSTGRLSI